MKQTILGILVLVSTVISIVLGIDIIFDGNHLQEPKPIVRHPSIFEFFVDYHPILDLDSQNYQTFREWCEDRKNLPPEVRHTVEVMLKVTRRNSCIRAEEILTNLRHFNYSYTQTGAMLEQLPLAGTEIVNIEPIASLPNVRVLYLQDNQIENIEPLVNLTNLVELYLDGNQIEDIRPLRNLTHLKLLRLANNQIKNIEPLANLTNLVELRLSGNQIEDIKPLQNLTHLELLNLSSNQIENIEPLANLANLVELRLRGNQIEEIGDLDNLKNLERLYFGNN